MSNGREIHCYEYVNHPYEQVREALTTGTLSVFRSATKAAASRASSVASGLRIELGGIALEAEINISVSKIDQKPAAGMSAPETRLRLEWEAAKTPRLFPLMDAELAIYPLTATETQLDFLGRYEPPLGAVGKALDAIAGHRIAEATVHRFVRDVAGYLRQSLG